MSLKKAVLLFLLGGAVVPAIGQQIDLPGTARTPASPANPAAANAPRPKVDETALRYFASQGDTRRLEAETARLRALYPDWTPPTDLFGPVTRSDPELERMWQLYADGKYGDVRSAIAARQASEPSWVVPPELLARLDEGEARRRIVNASDAQQWGTVLRVATETPGVLTCANVDVLWRVAEAFGKTNAPDRAQDVYGYVLNTCTDTGERVATLQKAIQLLDEQRVAVLMKLERPGPDGQGEFAVLRDDLVRARMGRAAQDEKQTVPADDIATMERLAKAGVTPDDALLLGWYLYRHNEPARALDWFKTALDRNGGAKAAEGYVLTLMSGGRALEAEPVAYQWRDSTPENRKAYLDVVVSLLAADPPPRLDAGILARFSPVVIADKYVSGAQAIGWYAYNTGQLRTAATWFRTAVDWAPDDEPSAYGLGVTSLRLKDKATLDAIVARGRPRCRARATADDAAGATAALSGRARCQPERSAAADRSCAGRRFRATAACRRGARRARARDRRLRRASIEVRTSQLRRVARRVDAQHRRRGRAEQQALRPVRRHHRCRLPCRPARARRCTGPRLVPDGTAAPDGGRGGLRPRHKIRLGQDRGRRCLWQIAGLSAQGHDQCRAGRRHRGAAGSAPLDPAQRRHPRPARAGGLQ
jgi:tetratricopeptide (TPR) repeat protein